MQLQLLYFSREPKWGWGYGGQVFHESLVMLAYAFMDPESAMNSQRVLYGTATEQRVYKLQNRSVPERKNRT